MPIEPRDIATNAERNLNAMPRAKHLMKARPIASDTIMMNATNPTPIALKSLISVSLFKGETHVRRNSRATA
jgi:hypothetical protein